MQIMKIDPNEKYVLIFPGIDDEDKMQKIVDSLTGFRTDGMHTVFFIYGEKVAIVPAAQIVGYKVIGKKMRSSPRRKPPSLDTVDQRLIDYMEYPRKLSE